MTVVGIDGHHLAGHEGLGTYVRSLVRGLEELSPAESVRVYRPAELSPRGWWRHGVQVPWLQVRDELDLWHTSWFGAPWGPARSVVAVHDVLFESRPEWFGRRGRLLRTAVRLGVSRAARVVVPSQATRAGLLEAYPWQSPEQVDVVPLAVDPQRFSPQARPDDEAWRASQGIEGPYALVVGRDDPRKNLETAFAAVARVPELSLVLVGPLRGRQPALALRARAQGLPARRLRVLPDVPGADLPRLYRGCRAFLFPTLAEGAGLPLLEALACGAPALVSDLPVLREYGEQAVAGYLDPRQVEAWVAQLLRPDLAGGAGPARARAFSCRALAEGTVHCWRRVLG